MNRGLTFILERFNPIAYLPMIAVFVGAHFALANLLGVKVNLVSISSVLLALGVLVFFLMLRLYDEIKDYEVDLQIHPDRPLPRRLVSIDEIKWSIVACIGIELICFGLLGFTSLIGALIAVGFSVLMYNEFFIRDYLRSHLTTYAVTHTAVSVLLSLAIFSAISSTFIWDLEPAAYYLALSSWCLFNIFEFGRKTFSSQEEKANVDSYSKLFGRFGAVSLVIGMAILSLIILSFTPFAQAVIFWPFIICASVVLGISGITYALYDKTAHSNIYRIASSAYLIVIYGGLIILSLRMV